MKSPEKLISSFVTSAEFVFFCKNSKLTIAKKCKKMNENLKALGISDQRERKSKRQFFPTHKTKTSTVFGLILLFSVGNTFKIEISVFTFKMADHLSNHLCLPRQKSKNMLGQQIFQVNGRTFQRV